MENNDFLDEKERGGMDFFVKKAQRVKTNLEKHEGAFPTASPSSDKFCLFFSYRKGVYWGLPENSNTRLMYKNRNFEISNIENSGVQLTSQGSKKFTKLTPCLFGNRVK